MLCTVSCSQGRAPWLAEESIGCQAVAVIQQLFAEYPLCPDAVPSLVSKVVTRMVILLTGPDIQMGRRAIHKKQVPKQDEGQQHCHTVAPSTGMPSPGVVRPPNDRQSWAGPPKTPMAPPF